jgi:hypothetical protein
MEPITLGLGEAIEVVVAGHTIRIEVTEDGAIRLGGVDCDLEGEAPGLYYPVAHAAAP